MVCVGGACIDRKYRVLEAAHLATSNPARIGTAFGGVARNVAENLARLGVHVSLLSAAGCDDAGDALLNHAKRAGIDVDLTMRDRSHRTPEYAAVVESTGDLVIGASAMDAVEAILPSDLERRWDAIGSADWIFVDCNVSSDVLAWCIGRARAANFRLAVDAVSERKVCRLPADLSGIDLLVLNEDEAAAYTGADRGAVRAQTLLQRNAACVLLTAGARGLTVAAERVVTLPAVRAACVDVTGAGDALIAATLWRLLAGDHLVEAARIGSLCAALTVEDPQSVRSDLSPSLVEARKHRLEACNAI